VYEVVLHVGAQLDHVVEVHTIHAWLMALSHVLELGTQPKKQLQFIAIAKALLNDVGNGESVPRCVNMIRSASPFHPGLCRVSHLLLHPQPLSDLCSWHLIMFVERGHSVRNNFHELKKSFVDIYTHEMYDLNEALASVETPFLVYEAALLAAGHVDMAKRLRQKAAEAGDCDDGTVTVCFALQCLAERLLILATRLRL
jgi:hypothetical protein